jgi:hypothetical protein
VESRDNSGDGSDSKPQTSTGLDAGERCKNSTAGSQSRRVVARAHMLNTTSFTLILPRDDGIVVVTH